MYDKAKESKQHYSIIGYSKKQKEENMQKDGFVSVSYGSPSEPQIGRANLETKRAGIHRMQRSKKEGRAGRSGHFKKCHSSLGIFFTLHFIIVKNTLLSQGTPPLWISFKTNFKQWATPYYI
ncbi:MAG: hypothetical protein ACTTJD_07070 [Porphyromonadaceae bacterium]